MDLQGAEQALRVLELEAQRVSGLGDLRQQLIQVQTDFSDAISALDSSVVKLDETLKARTDVLVRVAESLQTIVSDEVIHRQKCLERIVESTERIELSQREGLRLVDSQLRTGLDSIFAQIKSIVREIDQSVQSQLTRTLTEFQVIVRNEMRATNDRLDLIKRELVQSQASALSTMTGKFWLALAIEIALVSVVLVGIAWWLRFR